MDGLIKTESILEVIKETSWGKKTHNNPAQIQHKPHHGGQQQPPRPSSFLESTGRRGHSAVAHSAIGRDHHYRMCGGLRGGRPVLEGEADLAQQQGAPAADEARGVAPRPAAAATIIAGRGGEEGRRQHDDGHYSASRQDGAGEEDRGNGEQGGPPRGVHVHVHVHEHLLLSLGLRQELRDGQEAGARQQGRRRGVHPLAPRRHPDRRYASRRAGARRSHAAAAAAAAGWAYCEQEQSFGRPAARKVT